MQSRMKKGRGTGGNAVVEVSLLMPWFLFLFMGVFDFGFYAYALILTENAARAAGLHLSTSHLLAQREATNPAPATSLGACQVVLGEMRRLPNVGTSVTGCSALPVAVQVDLDPLDPPACQLADGSHCVRVRVTYRSVQLFPIPGLTGRLTATRTVAMRIFGR